jgi:hypothetical protein
MPRFKRFAAMVADVSLEGGQPNFRARGAVHELRNEIKWIWRRLQQAGGARVERERETSRSGEIALDWPGCRSALRAKEYTANV